jgi:pyruvate/2-oxoglutarate dehydrogenase complex dihydrolipoamide dehydrogenase (E3) component
MYDVLVLGGGPAGTTAALRARGLHASVALIERNRMGGTCTNDGCVPTRVLAKAARLLRDARQLQDYGIEVNAPRLDFPRLIQRTRNIVETIHAKKQLVSRLGQAGVEVWTDRGQPILWMNTRLNWKTARVCKAKV